MFLGLVFKGSCECFMLSLIAVRLRLHGYVDCIYVLIFYKQINDDDDDIGERMRYLSVVDLWLIVDMPENAKMQKNKPDTADSAFCLDMVGRCILNNFHVVAYTTDGH